MPQLVEEFYSQYKTGQTNEIIESLNEQAKAFWEIGARDFDRFYLGNACRLADKNLDKDKTGRIDFANIEGGPFAALIVREQRNSAGNLIAPPIVIGAGANHVVPENDPSAHGEMSAIRDATKRQGNSDLSRTRMYTSCECCPQCQAASTGVGIKNIAFANTRQDAADIGFSDAEQYTQIEKGMTNHMTKLDSLPDAKKADWREKLGDHGAVILNNNGEIVAYGDVDLTSNDPMCSLPSMNAIRAACKKVGDFHLPENYTLITKNAPHPTAFTTADWARIGRDRHPVAKDDPSKDTKNSRGIVYINPTPEEMQVINSEGLVRVLRTAADTELDVKKPPKDRTLVPTAHYEKIFGALNAFKRWAQLTSPSQPLAAVARKY